MVTMVTMPMQHLEKTVHGNFPSQRLIMFTMFTIFTKVPHACIAGLASLVGPGSAMPS